MTLRRIIEEAYPEHLRAGNAPVPWLLIVGFIHSLDQLLGQYGWRPFAIRQGTVPRDGTFTIE